MATTPDIFNPSWPKYFGNELVVTSAASDTINSATTWWAGMIRPSYSKNVTSLNFLHQTHAGSFETLTVGLYTDSGSGTPSSTLLQSATVLPSADATWESVTITSQAVTAGTPYWIVISGASLSGTNSITLRRVLDSGGAALCGSANKFSVATSSNSGSTWANTGSTWGGCVGLGYSDATSEGMGFNDHDGDDVGSTTSEYGEYFQVPATIIVNALSMNFFQSTAGTPSANLTYFLQNADTSTTLSTGTLIVAASLPLNPAWSTVTFSNITLVAGTNYRIYTTTAATSGTRYKVDVPKTVNSVESNAMTFGGTASYFTDYANGTPTNDPVHDIPFYLTLTVSPHQLTTLGCGT